MAGDLDRLIRHPWHEVRRKVTGAPDTPLHAAAFFRTEPFARIGATVTGAVIRVRLDDRLAMRIEREFVVSEQKSFVPRNDAVHDLVRADVPLLRRRGFPNHQCTGDSHPVGELVEQREVGAAVVFEVELQLPDDGTDSSGGSGSPRSRSTRRPGRYLRRKGAAHPKGAAACHGRA
ncbi:hypothetical protein [Bradyrhizobium cosmicum]|uniref:hypothetical protein n=1 Tax=Bradyrhizobium cosmicum TaxID=1404864 RepID=UPI0028E3CE89|nr:hypothetical protein [Bradyrhizobium cosmicum]